MSKKEQQQTQSNEKSGPVSDQPVSPSVNESEEDSSVTVEIESAEPGRKSAGEEAPTEEERLRSQVADLEDKLLRSHAELDNYKKRMARRFEEILETANDSLLSGLLDVVDNFERALEHSNDESNAAKLRKGTQMILDQMRDLIAKHGVTPIDAVGQQFDPRWHEAVMSVDSNEYPEGVVAVEMSKGYRIGDRVLRHSKVGVSRGAHGGQPESEG